MSHYNPDFHPSVLIEFRAQNVRSFRDDVALSMGSTAMSETRYVRKVQWREGGKPLSVLPVAGVFGANASGKSNLLKVMEDMRRHVLFSFKHGDPGGGVPRQPFLLDDEAMTRPSRYEIEIVLRGVLHQYGFAIDNEQVIEEWAYRFPKGRAALLFQRDTEGVHLGATDRPKGRAVQEILRRNALFLSSAAAADHPTLLPLYEWFEKNLLLVEADTRPLRVAFTAEMLAGDHPFRRAVLGLLRAADLGITDAREAEPDPAELERLRKALRAMHVVYDGEEPEQQHILDFDPPARVKLLHSGAQGEYEIDQEDESRGTLHWFSLIGPVLGALESGSVLLVDELDTSLHPDLVRELLRVFQDTETNTGGAQLLFNSHDMRLLGNASGPRPLGRDQIWFTEKDNNGSTRLYPLTDFEPRKQEAIGKRYLDGYYGARPIISIGDTDAAADLVTSGASSTGGRS